MKSSDSILPNHLFSNILNTPNRIQQGHSITPWEFILFRQLLSREQFFIHIDDLLEAYESIMFSNQLVPQSKESLIEKLNGIVLDNGNRLTQDNLIGYQGFHSSLKWFIRLRNRYCRSNLLSAVSNKDFKTLNYKKYGLIIFTSILDIFVIIMITLSSEYPHFLLIARISAVMILTNIAYILIPETKISNFVPDRIIANGLPVEYTHYYHKVFGIKVFAASIVHSLFHVLHVKTAIESCRNGCSQISIRIVPKSDRQVIISYGYFFRMYPYITGLILLILFTFLFSGITLNHFNMIRYSLNQLIHKTLARICMVMIVAHGCSQLLGFNFSFIFTLPLLLKYAWDKKREVIWKRIKINHWLITQSTTHLYLEDNKHLDSILDSFENVSVYVNHPDISRIEWHPFTLSRGYGTTNAILSMKRIGKWTNNFSKLLLNQIQPYSYLNIGYYKKSKFRFHHLYTNRYFFCSGIGITGFMATLSDMYKTRLSYPVKTTLLWSVNSFDIVKHFNPHLLRFQKELPNIEILIFYSNRFIINRTPSAEIVNRFHYLQSIIYQFYNIDILTGSESPICTRLQRVDFVETLSRAVMDSYKDSSKGPIGVFICGSKAYSQQAIQSVELVNNNKFNIQFNVWSEYV